MLRFIGKRLLMALPLLLFISFVTLVLIQCAPGDVFDSLRMNPLISHDIIRQYQAQYHLDGSVLEQYWFWLVRLCHGDLGLSVSFQQPVASLIMTRAGNTLVLSCSALALSWLIGVPLGFVAAMRKNSVIDTVIVAISYVCISFPAFFVAIIGVYLCAAAGGALPVGGMRSAAGTVPAFFDVVRHMIVPLSAMAAFPIGYVIRLMRASVLDVMKKDFVMLLRSKRSPRHVIMKHLVRNAINPLVTLLGLEIPALLSGSALVEILTNWPGLGQIMLQAVRSQDVFLVMGTMFMLSLLLVVGLIVSDVALALVDPRIRER